jgi:hypothetical protein
MATTIHVSSPFSSTLSATTGRRASPTTYSFCAMEALDLLACGWRLRYFCLYIAIYLLYESLFSIYTLLYSVPSIWVVALPHRASAFYGGSVAGYCILATFSVICRPTCICLPPSHCLYLPVIPACLVYWRVPLLDLRLRVVCHVVGGYMLCILTTSRHFDWVLFWRRCSTVFSSIL